MTLKEMYEHHKILPIDKAIHESISSIERPELKRKLYSNIILVGGSTLFEGFSEFLEDRY